MNEGTRQAMRLWTLAQPVVSAFVTSIVRDFSARDDVLQDVAVAVIESFDRYDRQRPFVAWALGIAQNQVRLYFRRCRRDQFVFSDSVIESIAAAFEPTSGRSCNRLITCKSASVNLGTGRASCAICGMCMTSSQQPLQSRRESQRTPSRRPSSEFEISCGIALNERRLVRPVYHDA